MFKNIKLSSCLIIILSSAFLAFGMYNVHSVSGVTEGGTIGLNLLLEHWFDISPAVSNIAMNIVCYSLGFKFFGKDFLIYSAVANLSFSVSYKVFEQFDPIFPEIYNYPLIAALVGAIFVGVGTGITVRLGGAICGDDALAMSLSHITHFKIESIYLISDITVLLLSLTYIPFSRIIYSLITVILSGIIIGKIQRKKTTQGN